MRQGTLHNTVLSLATEFMGAVQLLSDFPQMGRRVPGFRSRDIRQLIVRNHLVTYRLVGNEVRILEVKGGSQTAMESDFQ